MPKRSWVHGSAPEYFGRLPVFVGRAPQLEALQRGWEATRQGQGATVLVAGEAGIGKTRLLTELKAQATASGGLILQGNCFEADRSLPYAPWLDLLQAFGAGRSAFAPALESFSRAQPQDAAALRRLLPQYAPIASAIDHLGTEDEKPRLFRSLAAFFAHLGAQPLLLVLEDLHWSDDASLELVLYLARRLAAQPILLALSYRSDEVQPGLAHLLAGLDRERLAAELSLAPLARADIERMVQGLFGAQRAVPPLVLEALFALTEGNPFFVEEVVKSLVAGGGLLPASLEHVDVPRSVHDAVQRRTGTLSPAALRVLVLGAVIGRRFEFSLLSELTGMKETELVARLKELVSAQLLVEESADQFAFRHELTREAVNATILRYERRNYHHLTAEAIERLYPDAQDVHSADLAYHYFRAEAWEATLKYAQRAGEQATALYAPREAVTQFSRALTAARYAAPAQPLWGLLYRARGQAYDTLGEFDPAREDYQASLEAARSAGETRAEWQALLDLGFLWAARDQNQAAQFLQQALVAARALDDPAALAHTLNRVGNWHLNLDRSFEAIQYHEEALALFRAQGNRRGLAETFDLLGLAADEYGNHVQAARNFGQAVALWREFDDRQGLSSSLAVWASCALPYYSDLTVLPVEVFSEVRGHAAEALRLARDIGWRSGEAFALMVSGGNQALLGECGAALAAFERGLAVAEAINHRPWESLTRWGLGMLSMDLLLPGLGLAHLERGLALCREIHFSLGFRLMLGTLALAYIQQGALRQAATVLAEVLSPDFAAAEAASSRANDLARQPYLSMALRVCLYARAALDLARGAALEALGLADALIESAPNRAAYGAAAVPRLALLRAEALLVLSRPAEAVPALELALQHAQRLGLRHLVWRIHLALGRALRAQGSRKQAGAHFAAARALVDELALTLPDVGTRSEFLRQAAALLPPPRAPSRRKQARQEFGGLTARERDIAQRVAQGQSNREIALALVLSERTVEGHVTNCLSKLGLASRTQLAAWVHQHAASSKEEG